MPELHGNGYSENFLAQMFNPALAMANPAFANPALYGGIGAGQLTAPMQQTPWAAQGFPQIAGTSPQQQAQALIQCAQQIVARQTAQAIQCVQALQAVQQLIQSLLTQQVSPQFGYGFGANQPIYGVTQANPAGQAWQQIGQYLSGQQSGQSRFGLLN